WPNPSPPSAARRMTSRLKFGLTASDARLAALRAVGAAERGSSTSGVRSHPANTTHAATGPSVTTFMGASGGRRRRSHCLPQPHALGRAFMPKSAFKRSYQASLPNAPQATHLGEIGRAHV